MTIQQAKKDLASKLQALKIPYEKITGKTRDFSSFGNDQPKIFLKPVGINFQAILESPELLVQWQSLNETKGKGYIISFT